MDRRCLGITTRTLHDSAICPTCAMTQLTRIRRVAAESHAARSFSSMRAGRKTKRELRSCSMLGLLLIAPPGLEEGKTAISSAAPSASDPMLVRLGLVGSIDDSVDDVGAI